jgi:hypothetical protein
MVDVLCRQSITQSNSFSFGLHRSTVQSSYALYSARHLSLRRSLFACLRVSRASLSVLPDRLILISTDLPLDLDMPDAADLSRLSAFPAMS